LEGMERTAYLVSRYAIFEELYLHNQLSSFDGLERALVELYTTVLLYLSKARRYYDQNTACTLHRVQDARYDLPTKSNVAVRTIKNIVQLKGSDFEQLTSNIAQKRGKCSSVRALG